MKKLELIKTRKFGDVKCDFYQHNNEIWLTREQIGQALEYSNPSVAVGKIHNRHSARLDQFSTLTRVVKVEGSRKVVRDIVVYSRKGVMEICRWSGQPKANAFMDWVWSVIEEIMVTGKYELPQTFAQALRELANQVEENEILNKKIDYLEPKAEQHDVFLSGQNAQSISQVAKSFGWGRNRLFAFLREKKILITGGSDHNLPYQKYLDRNYFNIKESQVTMGDDIKNVTTTLVTPKGIEYIGRLLKQHGLLNNLKNGA